MSAWVCVCLFPVFSLPFTISLPLLLSQNTDIIICYYNAVISSDERLRYPEVFDSISASYKYRIQSMSRSVPGGFVL